MNTVDDLLDRAKVRDPQLSSLSGITLNNYIQQRCINELEPPGYYFDSTNGYNDEDMLCLEYISQYGPQQEPDSEPMIDMTTIIIIGIVLFVLVIVYAAMSKKKDDEDEYYQPYPPQYQQPQQYQPSYSPQYQQWQ